MSTDAQTRLLDAARVAPRSTIEAAARVLQLGAEPARAAFLARALNALARPAPELGGPSLGDAAGAPSDREPLCRALT